VFFPSDIWFSNSLYISLGCTQSECDPTGALSYCGPAEKPCNSGHQEVVNGKCRSKRCCRTACNGEGSYCFRTDEVCLPGHVVVSGKCPVSNHKCCKPL